MIGDFQIRFGFWFPTSLLWLIPADRTRPDRYLESRPDRSADPGREHRCIRVQTSYIRSAPTYVRIFHFYYGWLHHRYIRCIRLCRLRACAQARACVRAHPRMYPLQRVHRMYRFHNHLIYHRIDRAYVGTQTYAPRMYGPPQRMYRPRIEDRIADRGWYRDLA